MDDDIEQDQVDEWPCSTACRTVNHGLKMVTHQET